VEFLSDREPGHVPGSRGYMRTAGARRSCTTALAPAVALCAPLCNQVLRPTPRICSDTASPPRNESSRTWNCPTRGRCKGSNCKRGENKGICSSIPARTGSREVGLDGWHRSCCKVIRKWRVHRPEGTRNGWSPQGIPLVRRSGILRASHKDREENEFPGRFLNYSCNRRDTKVPHLGSAPFTRKSRLFNPFRPLGARQS
jgi:hypothetical protein